MNIEPIRLNIGAGFTQIPGFQPWDIKDGKPAIPLPHADNSVEEIYASHLLEHFDQRAGNDVLAEWVRVLKPGGKIRIAVPDIDALFEKHRNDERFALYLYGGAHDKNDIHRASYNEEILTRVMRARGLENIRRFESAILDCSKYPFSLNLEATKRLPFKINPNPKIVMCMSVGRLGFFENFESCHNGVSMSGIPLVAVHRCGSAYYEKSITHAIQNAIVHHDPDYIFTVDYDGLFNPEDVRKVLGVMQADPFAAAAFPIQMMRGRETVLCEDGSYDETISVAQHGHFGLTMIRADVFKKMPHPWFWSMPDTDGMWSDRCRDGDIVFWDKLRADGYKLVRLNEVVIGHMDNAIMWPDGDRMQWQGMEDYKKNGRPKTATWKKSSRIPDEFKWLEDPSIRTGWQYGEQGVIEEITRRLGIKTGTCVEFGTGMSTSVLTCQGLIRNGWRTVLFESNPEFVRNMREDIIDCDVVVDERAIYPTGANRLDPALGTHKVPTHFDVLVIDIDGYDYHVWDSLKSHRPKVVMVEHQNQTQNVSLSVPYIPTIEECLKAIKENEGNSEQHMVQANESALKRLGESKGYTRVAGTIVNSIFVANEFVHLLENAKLDDKPAVMEKSEPDPGAIGMHTHRILSIPTDAKVNGHIPVEAGA